MYVRLAFAVAAHLEPEILVVDEVLAVGDSKFQDKCLAKMRDITIGGRTILFVSHNMAAVTRLCERGMVLDSGMLRYSGSAAGAISEYQNSSAGGGGMAWSRPSTASTASLELVRISAQLVAPNAGMCLKLNLEFLSRAPHPDASIALDFVEPT
jgi:lipopolysaccharide transport system ATP-binding protein